MPQEPAFNESARFLAIDYGLKRIGLALSDPLNLFAYPFKTILQDQHLWNELEKIIQEKNVNKIILGYPYKSGGGRSGIAIAIEKFAKDLTKRFAIEIIFWDEHYTSAIAQAKILESVTKKSKRRDKGLLDMNSAAIILQEYINSLN
ncbi:MAG TPA: Holliday junction resolvase RuvX [Ignavibacteriaceae bacterium]|nr:Holliday junction resolvase RuvX [Ignavibacteriaceae bacterium]